MTNVWNSYARAYEKVLGHTSVYQKLIAYVLGDEGPLPPIQNGTTVLDCGAGPGLLVSALARSRPLCSIFAVENNPVMIELFLARCRKYMQTNSRPGSVTLFQLDLNDLEPKSLDPAGKFDVIFLVNALYPVKFPIPLLSILRRKLIPGGEIRLIGPRLDSDTSALLNALKQDLRVQGLYETLREEFECVRKINMEQLATIAYRWKTSEVVDFFLSAGFSDVPHASEEPYCGQAMCVVAKK